MKLIKPSYEIFEQGFEEQDIYKQIEKVGRTCYKSEDKITNESAKPFVDRMISSKHYAMLEHGTVYLYYTSNSIMQKDTTFQPHWKYEHNKYSKCNTISMQGTDCFGNPAPIQFYITTNLRVLVENNWLDDLQYLCEPTEFHERRICVKFTCDRGVSHEFVRHRVFSFAQESTRYCNYSKDKFGNELTFIFPNWMDEELLNSYGSYHTVARSNTPESIFIAGLNNAEKDYLSLINMGWKAQEARAILPNALKTELVITGFVSDWKHFFDLRAYGVTGKPHPQASELAIPLLNEFITKGYLHGSERN
jgi:thymidylate synthase (FAD)